MKRKGFTLIELLAVIAVLAIIALIAVPVIMNIIVKANKNAFKDSAYGIVKAGNLYYSKKEMNGETLEDEIFLFPDNIGNLDISNSHLINGKMRLTLDGNISFAITNGKYCARKELDKDEVIVDENLEGCYLVNPNISSDNTCIAKKTEKCSAGVKVNVKVNNLENYDFYVIKDTGSELTLIMDRNLGQTVAWISKNDYINANTDGTTCNYMACNDEGPLTFLKLLENRTNNWTNIEMKKYTLIDDGGNNKYKPIEMVNVRARMLTWTEAKNLGCNESSNSCPDFLYENLSETNTETAPHGYWTSSAIAGSPYARRVDYNGRVYIDAIYGADNNGIRPVIEISKTV